MERIRAFSLASPLAKFLNGLEILLSKAQVRFCSLTVLDSREFSNFTLVLFVKQLQ